MRVFVALASVFIPCAVAGQDSVPSATMLSTVPSIIRTTGDNPRVIVTATINGHPMRMMVHSYANEFAQLRHREARLFGVRLRPGTHRAYGIDSVGHVSPLGRDEGVAKALAVGRSVDVDAPISVFEVPQGDYGILGTGWIRANRVVVDFARNQVSVAPTPAQTRERAKTLLRNGYRALPMRYNPANRFYYVHASINGVGRDMAVTTASVFQVDLVLANQMGIKHGKDVGEGDGPTGTSVPNYLLGQPVRVTIGNWTSPAITDGRISDGYAYIAQKRPDDPSAAVGGELGGSFLQKTGAVVDFGALTLFVRE